VQDAGDTLHSQANALDSAFVFDTNTDYSNATPLRWLAEGRDPSATIDAQAGGFGKNDGDNEITGIHVSDGDPSIGGILGAKVPTPFRGGWRWFWTQQHGDNVTWEVLPADAGASPGGPSDQGDG
jgi:hypothetical protein